MNEIVKLAQASIEETLVGVCDIDPKRDIATVLY
jgi:hypothetical protein